MGKQMKETKVEIVEHVSFTSLRDNLPRQFDLRFDVLVKVSTVLRRSHTQPLNKDTSGLSFINSETLVCQRQS